MDSKILQYFGAMIILSSLIPITSLSDSQLSKLRNKEVKGTSSPCSPFKTPVADVGRYSCMKKRGRKGYGETYACKLYCPGRMIAQPYRTRVLHRCLKGEWTVFNEVHCLARSIVPIVEQNLSSPKYLNQLIAINFRYSYSYLAMAQVFERADVDLPGFEKYFTALSTQAYKLATNLMSYMNKRGGYVNLQQLPRPRFAEKLLHALVDKRIALVAMKTALNLEKGSQSEALKIIKQIKTSEKDFQDPHLLHYLKRNYLIGRVKNIKDIMGYVSQLRAFDKSNDGDYELGEYTMDIHLQQS